MNATGVPPRRSIEFVALGGALLATVLGQVAGVPSVVALGLACAAASALGLMLQRVQIIGWLLTLLAVLGIILAIEAGITLGYFAIVGFAVVLGASRIIVRFARAWTHTVQKRQASAPPDPWKEQDKGLDPTDEMPEQGDSR